VLLKAFLGEEAPAADFVPGADVSHLRFFEDRGIVYRHDGLGGDAVEILKQRGIRCLRLRLFTSSAAQANADPYDYVNNLDYTLPLAVRVKQAGLQFLLDFHYSDTWADPGTQSKPAAWTNLAFAALEQQMYVYNRDTIAAFKAAGAMPDYIQVGNEITGGLLWPEGRVGGAYDTPVQWNQLGRLVQAAIRGIHDGAGAQSPRIIIHIDRGGDWNGTQWFFDHLREQQVDFDVIGESYYPFWHGPLSALRACLGSAASRYGKDLFVLETAFPWANSTNVAGLPATAAGQADFVVELAKVVKGVSNGRGAGIFWWGTEYQHLNGVATAGFEFRSWFDADGNVLPAASNLGELGEALLLNARLTGADLALTWPLSGAGLSLVATTNLGSPALWAPLTNAIENTGTLFQATLPLPGHPTGFFRLQSN
jgi:arabinogalactan endo-1,4-beta-galactosidase